MGYVGPRGIPLEEFLRWSRRSQDAALTWQAHEAARCPGCRRHPYDPPRHPHIEVCPECRAWAAASKAVKTDQGEHLVWAPGYAHECPNPEAHG